MTDLDRFKYSKTSEEIIRLAVMMYVRFPPSLRDVEDLLHERRIEIRQESVRFGAPKQRKVELFLRLSGRV